MTFALLLSTTAVVASAPTPTPTPTPTPPTPTPYVAPMPYYPAPYGEQPPYGSAFQSAPPSHHLAITASVGTFYEPLYALHTYGGVASVALGFGGHLADAARPSFYMGFTFEEGRSEHGLGVSAGQISFYPEWTLGRVRLGLEWRAGFLDVQTVTSQPTIGAVTIGGAVRAGVDLFQFSDQDALYLVGNFGNDSFIWNARLSLGYRWDSKP